MVIYIELVQRVHELNERVEDIQIEQNAQRVSLRLRIKSKRLILYIGTRRSIPRSIRTDQLSCSLVDHCSNCRLGCCLFLADALL